MVKNALHPLLFLAFSALVTLAPSREQAVVIVAAGPCGAMPFVIALQYGVRTDVIARAILLSTVFSLASLALPTAQAALRAGNDAAPGNPRPAFPATGADSILPR